MTCAASATCRSTAALRALRGLATIRQSCGAGCVSMLLALTFSSPCAHIRAARAAAVLTLLPPHVHHDVASKQEHVPDMPSQMGVCVGAKAEPGDTGRAQARRGLLGGSGCRRWRSGGGRLISDVQW